MPAKKVTISMDQGLFEEFEKFCRERGYKKSGLISFLIREHLRKEGHLTTGEQKQPRRTGGERL